MLAVPVLRVTLAHLVLEAATTGTITLVPVPVDRTGTLVADNKAVAGTIAAVRRETTGTVCKDKDKAGTGMIRRWGVVIMGTTQTMVTRTEVVAEAVGAVPRWANA